MTESITKIFISNIIMDEAVNLRERIGQKRGGLFAENIRDNWPAPSEGEFIRQQG